MQFGFAADAHWWRGALLLLQHGEVGLEIARRLHVLKVALYVTKKASLIALLRILNQPLKLLHSALACIGARLKTL